VGGGVIDVDEEGARGRDVKGGSIHVLPGVGRDRHISPDA